MKFLFKILLISLCILFIAGCEAIETKPSFDKIELDSATNNIPKGDEFRIFFTIKNPTEVYLTPYIEAKFDEDNIQAKEWTLERGERLELPKIPSKDSKSYYLDFNIENNAKDGNYEISFYLYSDEESKVHLHTTSINIVVPVSR